MRQHWNQADVLTSTQGVEHALQEEEGMTESDIPDSLDEMDDEDMSPSRRIVRFQHRNVRLSLALEHTEEAVLNALVLALDPVNEWQVEEAIAHIGEVFEQRGLSLERMLELYREHLKRQEEKRA